MEAKFLSSAPIFPLISSTSTESQCRKIGLSRRGNRSSGGKVFATARGGSNGRNVDENMIVLRKRIHEMKMIDRNYEAPAEWMEWEKRYYTCYDEYICEFVGVLQSQLMDSRPCLAIGMIAFVMMSVPISTAVILKQLSEVVNQVISGVNFN